MRAVSRIAAIPEPCQANYSTIEFFLVKGTGGNAFVKSSDRRSMIFVPPPFVRLAIQDVTANAPIKDTGGLLRRAQYGHALRRLWTRTPFWVGTGLRKLLSTSSNRTNVSHGLNTSEVVRITRLPKPRQIVGVKYAWCIRHVLASRVRPWAIAAARPRTCDSDAPS